MEPRGVRAAGDRQRDGGSHPVGRAGQRGHRRRPRPRRTHPVGQVGPRRRRTDLGSAQSPRAPIEPAGTGAHSGGPEPGADEPARLANPAGTDLPEIDDVITRFATAAVVCETAGFDGVQIHGAHGYLVTQFLSPLTNQRTDAWGGDPDRRMRFLLEIVRRIRARVSPGFAVSVKLNSADFQRGGFSEDESRHVVAALASEGLDLIEISGGNYESPAMSGSAAASTRDREAYFIDYARTVRQVAGDVPWRSPADSDRARPSRPRCATVTATSLGWPARR